MEASDLLRGALLGLSKSDLVRTTIEKAPVSRSVVARYVPGTGVPDAVAAAAELRATNRLTTIDYLGEDTTDRAQAEHTRDTYITLLDALAEADLTKYG
ncbi:MAG TPA: proline dehydrogenase, partial [Phycicoccus sp.]|nr:proline dehydrogenase [Phycicoccus sp.]